MKLVNPNETTGHKTSREWRPSTCGSTFDGKNPWSCAVDGGCKLMHIAHSIAECFSHGKLGWWSMMILKDVTVMFALPEASNQLDIAHQNNDLRYFTVMYNTITKQRAASSGCYGLDVWSKPCQDHSFLRHTHICIYIYTFHMCVYIVKTPASPKIWRIG